MLRVFRHLDGVSILMPLPLTDDPQPVPWVNNSTELDSVQQTPERPPKVMKRSQR